MDKPRAPRNRTLTLSEAEHALYRQQVLRLVRPMPLADVIDTTIQHDTLNVARYLPPAFADVLILDPPYYLNKTFGATRFRKGAAHEYVAWFTAWFVPLLATLKPTASVYVCSDWQTSLLIAPVLSEHLLIHSRITWEREKGRGARHNWKNAAEDIWFASVADDYYFDVEAVKLKKRVLAPYRDSAGQPKDWATTDEGNYRLTHPSNVWTDISVPFWSMPENTDHPTQKPEKLIAKLILASSRPGDVIFDPFLGSGTTSVVAKKLGRRYVGVELDEQYCCLALKRLALAEEDASIQGYSDGVFWERNSAPTRKESASQPRTLFHWEDES